MVRDLLGTVNTQGAEMGLLITMQPPTTGMIDAANHSGSYTWPVNGVTFPKVQVITVPQLLNFKRPSMPPPLPPYIAVARRRAAPSDQMSIAGALGEPGPLRHIEQLLVQKGLVLIRPSGRELTEDGVERTGKLAAERGLL